MTFTVFFVNERILPGARLVCLSRPLNGRFLQNLMGFSCFLDLKFSDRHVWANSADPDQTAPRGAV